MTRTKHDDDGNDDDDGDDDDDDDILILIECSQESATSCMPLALYNLRNEQVEKYIYIILYCI